LNNIQEVGGRGHENRWIADVRELGKRRLETLQVWECGSLAQSQLVSETRKGDVMVQADHHAEQLDYYKNHSKDD
jgi:hypothetical protein